MPKIGTYVNKFDSAAHSTSNLIIQMQDGPKCGEEAVHRRVPRQLEEAPRRRRRRLCQQVSVGGHQNLRNCRVAIQMNKIWLKFLLEKQLEIPF